MALGAWSLALAAWGSKLFSFFIWPGACAPGSRRLGLFFIQIFIDLVDRKIAAKSKTKPKEPTLLR